MGVSQHNFNCLNPLPAAYFLYACFYIVCTLYKGQEIKVSLSFRIYRRYIGHDTVFYFKGNNHVRFITQLHSLIFTDSTLTFLRAVNECIMHVEPKVRNPDDPSFLPLTYSPFQSMITAKTPQEDLRFKFPPEIKPPLSLNISSPRGGGPPPRRGGEL